MHRASKVVSFGAWMDLVLHGRTVFAASAGHCLTDQSVQVAARPFDPQARRFQTRRVVRRRPRRAKYEDSESEEEDDIFEESESEGEQKSGNSRCK